MSSSRSRRSTSATTHAHRLLAAAASTSSQSRPSSHHGGGSSKRQIIVRINNPSPRILHSTAMKHKQTSSFAATGAAAHAYRNKPANNSTLTSVRTPIRNTSSLRASNSSRMSTDYECSSVTAPIQGSVLSLHNVSYVVKNRKFPWNSWEEKQILKDVNGVMKPGLNAIMGPTGCGKSSMLDVLAGRKNPSFVKGLVLVDGRSQPSNFNCLSGYVLQDDILMGTLTVEESLQFSAALRLPAHRFNDQRRTIRVKEIINELGLNHVVNSKIGTEFIRGISGGERKRTSIGMELVIDPPVLFLDEPTTGLDAFTANSVMKILYRLGSRGRTIIFSIHQPKYSIYKLFSSFTLLCRGEMVYHGPAGLPTLQYFSTFGYQCDPHDNPADFVLDILNGHVAVTLPTIQEESEVRSNSAGDELTVVSTENGEKRPFIQSNQPTSDTLIKAWKNSYVAVKMKRDLNNIFMKFKRDSCNAPVMESDETPTCHSRKRRLLPTPGGGGYSYYHINNFFTEMRHVGWRTVRNLLRNPQGWISHAMVLLIFAFIMGTVYAHTNLSLESGIQNRRGLFFFTTMLLVFINLSAIEVFIKERQIFVHENARGFYRTSVYFFCKVLFDQLPQKTLPIILFMPITYFMVGLRGSVDAVFLFEMTLLLATIAACGVAFAISATISILGLAEICTSVTFVFMMVFGGFLVNLNSLASWLSWCRYLSIFRYSISALSVNELLPLEFCSTYREPIERWIPSVDYNNVNFTTTITTTRIPLTTTQFVPICQSGAEILTQQGVPDDDKWGFWQNIVGLTVIIMIAYTVSYIQLRRLNRYM